MAVLIVAGVPRRAFRRRDAVPVDVAVPGWTVEVIASGRDEATLAGCWQQVEARIEQIDQLANSDGVHLFVFHRSQKEYGERYARAIRDHHRIRLLQPVLIQSFGTTAFNEDLTRLVEIEEQWRNQIKPKHSSDPAILPEGYFIASPPFNDLWHRVRDYDGTDSVSAVRSLVANFRVTYNRPCLKNSGHATKHVYRDDRGYEFDPRGPRHGKQLTMMKDWKFGLQLPPAFHFDLQPGKGGAFYFQCRDNAQKRYETHCNMDAFGYQVGA